MAPPGLWASLLSLLALICISGAMNVNRPPGRWARNEQFDDGWRGSLGPFDPLREPSARRTQDEIPFQPLPSSEPIIPTTAAAAGGEGGGGIYELVVGRKSSQSDSLQAAASAFGSPDVIIGRVMPSDDADIQTAAAVSSLTTEAVVGHSHYNSEIEGITTDVTDATAVTQQQQRQHNILKKTDLLLPPGSFYLPAVSRHSGEYYSQSEQAIYIPLARPPVPHQDSFPVSTRVVLVDHKLPQGQQRNQRQPTAASLENVSEDNDGGDTVEEEDVEEDNVPSSSEEQAIEVVDSGRRRPPSSVPTRGKSQPDLVMTLYPNLSNLLPQSSIRNLGVKSFPRDVRAPNPSGASSVIHDAKVVTPPHGYLPSVLANTKQKSAPESVQQQQSQRPQRLASKPHLLNVPSQSSSTNIAQASNVKTTVKAPIKGIVYTPFTPDDISPLNYLSPAQLSAALRSVPLPSSSAFDQVPAPSFAVFQQATIGTPNFPSAKSMDFTWNVSDIDFVPRPAPTQQLLPQTTTALSPIPNSATASIQQIVPVQQQQQLLQLHQDDEPREVVVRTKFSAANLDRPDSSSFVINKSNNSDSSDIEIITGYFDDLSGEGTKSGATYDIVPQLVHGRHEETVVAPQNHLQPQVADTASGASVAYSIVVQPDTPAASEAASSSTEPITSSKPPILHGNFQPMLESTATSPDQNKPLVPSPPIRITEKDAMLLVENSNDSGEFSAKLKPDHKFFIEEKHRVAESQVHQTLHREESQPEVQAINHKVSEQQGSLVPRHYYYKAGQISPKGAVYTVTQGHSKVKFFGFNALHLGGDDGSDGELLKQPDGKYPLFYSNYQLPGGWSPYSPIASSPPPTPTFKIVPKKSISIGSKSKSSIRPVHFVKRPATAEDIEASDTSSIAISDPYEYHQHLQKMANEDRLPTSSTPNPSWTHSKFWNRYLTSQN